MSLLCDITLDRKYYYCPTFPASYSPTVVVLSLTESHFTLAATEVICIAGVETSFAVASEVTLEKLYGLWVSESKVERPTKKVGQELGARLAAEETFGEDQPWEWEHDAQGHTCAYVGGAMRQASVNKANMAREPTDAWSTWASCTIRAAQVGIDQVEQQIALSDGGSDLEDFFHKNFPRAKVILDFWYAKEYVVEFRQAFFGDENAAGQRWLAERCHQLKHEGGAPELATLKALDTSQSSETVRSKLQSAITYYRNHQHKMDYPRYLANGWQIGSGPVENECNPVVNQQLAGPSRRWRQPGSDAVCHLRALYRSEPTQ